MLQQCVAYNLDVMRHIYAFDGTYKQIFTDHVLIDIWRRVWEHYLDTVTDPVIVAVLCHCFEVWGVSETNMATYQPDMAFVQRHYFPDRMNVFTHEDFDGSVRVMVFMQIRNQTVSVFNGRVLTPEMHDRESQYEGSWRRDDAIYEDGASGFVVYI